MIDRTVPRFALFAALALLAAAPLPATLASQETWLGEMLVEDLGIPKDELSTEVESLIQGYQQRLASEHISSGEVRDLVRMVLAADTGLDSADPIDMAKRMRTIRENGGATMLEFMTRVQPLVKMSPDRYERFAAVRQTFDVAAPLYHDPIARTQRVLDNLPEVLDLNEEQRAQFDQMLASLKESGVEKYSAANLYQELLASEDAGTSETSAMLRQRIDSLLEGYEGHVAALFERLGVLEQPAVVDRKHIIGVPDQIRVIPFFNPQQFVGGVFRRSSAVGVAVDRMAAPFTGIRTATRLNHRYRTLAVMVLPHLHITWNVYRFPVRPGKRA